MKRKRLLSVLLSLCLLVGVFAVAAMPATEVQAAKITIGDMDKFTCKGSMSQEVLRSYCAHAVTLQGLCVEGTRLDNNFEDDLRMIKETGAKFIGRTAFYSWSGNLSAATIEEHFKLAKQQADAAHKVDPELILQAGVFEIAYKGTVNNTAIPAYVFEAFDLPVEKRNFDFDKIKMTSGTYGGDYWNSSSCVPDITQTETQMYFYYLITRYIDAGYESVHMGQAGMMANQKEANFVHWDKVTTLARQYAKTHARRGVILLDAHVNENFKVGNRLIADLYVCCIAGSNETEIVDDVMMAELKHYQEMGMSGLGRAKGGEHPLGFTVDKQYTIIEFDNHGGNDNPGVPTFHAFYIYGYDDITWFTLQPEWYRNKFLAETQEMLSTDKRLLDKDGNQTCFIQFPMRRVTTAAYSRQYYYDNNTDISALMDAADKSIKVSYDIEEFRKRLTFKVGTEGYYRANNQSPVCPSGSNQEAIIKTIFSGKKADEALFEKDIETKSAKRNLGATTKKTTTTTTKKPVSSTTKGDADASTTKAPVAGNTTTAPTVGGDTAPSIGDEVSVTDTVSQPESVGDAEESTEQSVASDIDTDTDPSSQPDDGEGGLPLWAWIALAAVAVAAVIVAIVLVLIKKKKAA